MTDRNTEIDLAVLHQAIVADIKAQFPSLATVEFYRGQDAGEDRRSLTTPACLLDLTELEAEPEADPGTEQLAMVAKFEAALVIDFRTTSSKLSIRQLAVSLAAWLRLRRWGNPAVVGKKLPTGPAQVIGAYPDDFQPDLERFVVWRVEWQQVIHLGQTVWKPEGAAPTTVLLGGAPDIGIGHEPDYVQIAP